jgi:hypothetical protein
MIYLFKLLFTITVVFLYHQSVQKLTTGIIYTEVVTLEIFVSMINDRIHTVRPFTSCTHTHNTYHYHHSPLIFLLLQVNCLSCESLSIKHDPILGLILLPVLA